MDSSQLGFSYRRKRSDSAPRPLDITPGAAAEAILSVWRHRPHQAKFFICEHFGRCYDEIFSHSLHGSQVTLAAQSEPLPRPSRKQSRHLLR